MDDHNEKNQPEQTQETKPAYNVPPIPTRAQPVPPPQVGVIPQAGYTPPPKVGYNPPPVQSQSYNPPPSVQPQSYNPPPPVQPQSYNPPPAQEVNTPSYTQTPPPSAAYGYPLAYQTAPVNASKMSKSTLIAIIVTAAVVLILIGVIIYGVVTNDSSGVNLPKSPTTITNPFSGKQNAVNVDVEQVERPALENEMYQNQVTGLLTPEGVFEYVLPSSVLVNVFGDNFFSPIAYGSGVVMSSNGYIITNAHVVDGGESYSITTSDGENYEAEFIGMDSSEDVAVLKINAEGLTPATFGKTEDVKLGESIAIIANASEYLRNFATYGHISNLEQEIITDYGSTLRVFQTDAAVNAGTSGGPAVNMYGQVIGIVVGKQVDPEMNMTESVGFLLRIDTVIDVAEQLIENGYVEGEVKIGITYQPLDNLTASYYDLPSGLLIYSVVEDSGAKAAGIVVNDIITEIDGVPVLSEESIKKALEGKRAGDIVVVSVARKKITGEVEELEMNLTLGQKIDLPSNESYTTTTHEHEEPEE
jgi:serine protease Do